MKQFVSQSLRYLRELRYLAFDAENDQMVVSVNAPRAEEEEVEIEAEEADGETSSEGDAEASDDSEGSDESDENS